MINPLDKVKQQFLALYLGQPCLTSVAGLLTQQKLLIDADLLSTEGSVQFTEVSACLKRLEDVSISDAIQLYCLKYGIFSKDRMSFISSYEYSGGLFQIQCKHSNYAVIQKSCFSVNELNWRSIDFLRSKGYCLPYLDFNIRDLVDKKWVTFITH